MIRPTPDFLARSAVPRASFTLRVGVTGVVCALLTSAMVLAQDPRPIVTPLQPQFKPVEPPPKKVVKKGEAKAKARPAPAVVRKQAAFDVNVNGNPMIEQFAQQGRPLVHAELLFVRHICNLSPQQLRPISRETDQALRDVAKKMVENQQNGMRIRLRGQADPTLEPSKLLQEEMALVIKKHLTPEQYANYRSEFEKRSANRKQAALSFLVDVLDRDLVLSGQQREKVTESLSAHWDDGWCMYMEYMLHGNQFYPYGMDQYVTPLLNDNQKKVWQGVQKVQGFWGFGNVMGMGGMINGGDPLLAELGFEENAEPKPAEAAKGPLMKVQMKKIESKKDAATKK